MSEKKITAHGGAVRKTNPYRKDRALDPSEIAEHCISIYDHNSEDSVWYRMAENGKRAIDSVPEYLKTWGLKALEKKLDSQTRRGLEGQRNPDRLSTKDKQFRISFWLEYEKALDRHKMMSLDAICRGICTPRYVYSHIFRDPVKMAWLLTPPTDYTKAMQEMMDLGIREMRKIMTLPNKDSKGKINTPLLGVKLKVFQMVENRVKGVAPKTYNINQKNLNVNVDGNSTRSLPPPPVRTLSDSELDDELKRLKNQLKELPPEDMVELEAHLEKKDADERREDVEDDNMILDIATSKEIEKVN